MDVHPITNVFPLLEGESFEQLVFDIHTNGLRQTIVLHPNGRVLDGRNRYRACLEAKVAPRFETWGGAGGSEVAFVLSLNIHRRHLDESQRAMVAAAADLRRWIDSRAGGGERPIVTGAGPGGWSD